MASTGDGVVFLDPPSEFNCSSCSCQLSDFEGAVNEIHIYSVANEFEKSITILDALWEIFGSVAPNASKLNKLQLARNSDVTLLMCSKCAQVMSLLYKDFLTLIQIAATDGYVSNLLHHMESWQNKVMQQDYPSLSGTEVATMDDEGDSNQQQEVSSESRPLAEELEPTSIDSTQEEEHLLVPLLDTASTNISEIVVEASMEVFGPVDENESELQYTKVTQSAVEEPRDQKFVVLGGQPDVTSQFLTAIGKKKRRRPTIRRSRNSSVDDSGVTVEKKYVKAPLSETGRIVGQKKRHFFRCSLCPTAFFYNWELYDHLLLIHMKKERSVCGKCGWEYYPEILNFDTHKCPVTDAETSMDIRYPYRCAVCDIIFDKESSLKSHQESVHVVDMVQFECVFCHKNCVRRSSLLQHYSLCHPETCIGDKHICSFCGMGFDGEIEMREHISQAHEAEYAAENPEKCNYCERRYQTSLQKLSHMKNVHGYRRSKQLPPEGFPCPDCGKAFITTKRLRKHISFKHGDNRGKNKQCNICAKTFWTRHKLLMHMRTHTYGANANTRVPKEFAEYNLKYNCKHCPLTFNYKAHADLHNRNFHGIKEDGYKCVECEQLFATNLDLLVHKRKHYTLEQKKAMPWTMKGADGEFDCDICGKAYSSLKNLFTHHNYVHVGNNSVVCDLCHKELRARNLNYHNRAFHPERAKQHEQIQFELLDESDVLTCDVCNNGKVYSSRRALLEHKGIHDGSYLKVSCPKCGLKLRSNQRLRIHDFQVHSGKFEPKPVRETKPESEKLPCTICKKVYTSLKTLKEHQEIHTDQHMKARCQFCPFRTRRKQQLKIHMETMHPSEEFESPSPPPSKKGKFPVVIKSEPLSESEIPEDARPAESPVRTSQRLKNAPRRRFSIGTRKRNTGRRTKPRAEDVDFLSYFLPVEHGMTKRLEIKLTRIEDEPEQSPQMGTTDL